MGVDDNQAAYWNGFISRSEAQKVFDEFSEALHALRTQMVNMDFCIGALAEKLGLTPEDVSEYAARRLDEMTKAAKPGPRLIH